MSSTRFRSGGIELELHGSEEFVLRQLRDLAFALGPVDSSALSGYTPASGPNVEATRDDIAADATAPAPDGEPQSERVAPPTNDSLAQDALRSGATDSGTDVPGGATNGTSTPANGVGGAAAESTSAPDALIPFFQSVPPMDRDRQAHAALVFAYHLHREEGLREVRIGDLLKCCIRVGVDSRNFHRAIGVLTRRSLLAEVRRGSSYRITDQGMAAIEERLS